MKNRLFAVLSFILVLAMLTGCGGGISPAKYDSAVAEKDNIQRQITEVQGQLIAAQNKIYQLQSSGGGSGSAQTGTTDLSRVSWRPVTYIDKTYGFKVSYPDTWKITTRGTKNVPVEIQFNSADLVPGSWMGIVSDTADTKYTQSALVDLVSSWQDYQFITSGDTVLADNSTPASYVEFIATVDTYLKHIYALGYVDGDHWIYFAVWTRESIVPWDGNLMRQIAHTLNKATADEITTGITTPTTTPTTTTATTAAVSYTAYTDTTYKFTFKYDANWTATWNGINNPVCFGDPTYFDPSVRIYVFPKATGATLADVLKSSAMATALNGVSPVVIDKTLADMTNVNGTTATPITFHFNWTDGTTAQSEAYGLLKGDNWFIMFLTRSSGWNMPLSSIYPDDVFASWKFTQ
jgi:hypothetical protein